MTWILVNALDHKVAMNLNNHWIREGRQQNKALFTNEVNTEGMFLRRLNFKSYIMHNNGEALAYLANLKMRYGESIQLYVMDALDLKDLPDNVMKVARYLATHSRQSVRLGVRNTPEVNYDMEELRKCKVEYSKNLRRKPYTLQEIRALRERMDGVLKEAE